MEFWPRPSAVSAGTQHTDTLVNALVCNGKPNVPEFQYKSSLADYSWRCICIVRTVFISVFIWSGWEADGGGAEDPINQPWALCLIV